MVNHDNYYQDIIGKINDLITENHWNQAMILVKHELDMPYIPHESEIILQQLHHEIVTHIKSNTKVKIREWNLEEISQVLMNPLAEEIHPVAFYYLQSHNVRLILPLIQKYLLTNTFSNVNKTQLLFLLKAQGINQPLKIIKTHDTFIINPSELTAIYDLPIYQIIIKLFEDEVHIDNPGIYQICLFLLDNYINNLFPMLPKNNQANPLAAALYIRACSLQFINVTLLASANKFRTTTILIKKYLAIIKQQQIT